MLARVAMFIAVVALATGCGSTPPPIKDEVDVKGKVTMGGSPLGDVNLILQPTEGGYMKTIRLNADGSFSAKAVPGKYMHYFAAVEGKDRSEQTKFNTIFNKVPESARTANLSSTVQVGSADIVIDVK